MVGIEVTYYYVIFVYLFEVMVEFFYFMISMTIVNVYDVYLGVILFNSYSLDF